MDITTDSRIQKVEEEPLPVERPDLEHSHAQEPGSRPEGEHEMQAVDGSARQLNVTDALSYLDAVKTQFVERPDVYNNFLDIMKDFKSQAYANVHLFDAYMRLFLTFPTASIRQGL